MNITNFLKEGLEHSVNSFNGVDENDIVVEAKGKNIYTEEQIVELLGDKIAKSNKISDVLFPERSIGFGTVWYKNYKIRKWSGSISVTDVTNATKRGKNVKNWVLSSFVGGEGLVFLIAVENYINGDNPYTTKKTIEGFIEVVEGIKKAGDMSVDYKFMLNGREEHNFMLRASIYDDIKASTKFAPLGLKDIKPLDKVPTKPNVLHLIKAIVNGQYKFLGRTSRYTDDYAYDAMIKFGVDDAYNPIKLVSDMIERGSSYNRIWAHNNDKPNLFTFGSSFETFEIEIDINASVNPKEVIKAQKNKYK